MSTSFVQSVNAPGLYGDGFDGARGLYLQVTASKRAGRVNRSWVYRFNRPGDGKPRWMGLGPADCIPLAKARELAVAARQTVKLGADPIAERQKARDALRADTAGRIAFKDAADKFLAVHQSKWTNHKHIRQWRSTLAKYAFPMLGSRPAASVDGALITQALAPIWTTKHKTANRTKQRIERVVQWVKDDMPAPALGKKPVHLAALPYADLPDFMGTLRQRDGIAASALEFCILTAGRTGEVLGASWSEIDLAAKVWTIPAARMKAKRPHRVPLPERAIELLTALPREDGGFVFPGAKAGRPLGHNTLLNLLAGMGCKGATVHGFRSAFRDWTKEQTTTPREIAELALAHAVADKTEAAYARGDALDRRRPLMEAWATYCSGEQHSASVTPIRASSHAS